MLVNHERQKHDWRSTGKLVVGDSIRITDATRTTRDSNISSRRRRRC